MVPCDTPRCRRLATRNFQKVWIDWRVDATGHYTGGEHVPDQDPGGEDNLHYCARHAAAWLRGEG